MSWAFGDLNGRAILLRNGEIFVNNNGVEEINQGDERVINKLQLGMINMNNEMRILTIPDSCTENIVKFLDNNCLKILRQISEKNLKPSVIYIEEKKSTTKTTT